MGGKICQRCGCQEKNLYNGGLLSVEFYPNKMIWQLCRDCLEEFRDLLVKWAELETIKDLYGE